MNKLSKSDFTFLYHGAGYYKVTFQGKSKLMPEKGLLENILHDENPFQSTLELLAQKFNN